MKGPLLMRIKMFVLAFVASVATALPAQAGAILGFGLGNTQTFGFDPNTPLGDPGNPNGGTSTDPHTLTGLNDWSLGSRLGDTNGALAGTSAGNRLVIDANTTSQVILQIQLRDTAALTFANTSTNTRMFQWGALLSWTGSGVSSTADNNPNNGQAYQQTVNDSSGASNENIPYANNTTTANGYGLGNIFFTPWNSQFTTFQDNGSVFTSGTATAGPRNYVLANFILNIAPTGGDSTITLTDMNLSQVNWSNGAGTPLDATIFSTIPQLFIHVTPAPEPSSMALVGLAVSGLAYRIRRKKAAAVAAAV